MTGLMCRSGVASDEDRVAPATFASYERGNVGLPSRTLGGEIAGAVTLLSCRRGPDRSRRGTPPTSRSHRQCRRADAETERSQRYERTAALGAQGVIERQAAGAGLGECDHCSNENGVVLPPTVGIPRTIRQVHLVDRRGHHAGEAGCGEWSGEPDGEQGAPGGFRYPSHRRVHLRWPHVQRLHHAFCAGPTRAAEPAEELLGAVADEQPPYDGSYRQASDAHTGLLLAMAASAAGGHP